MNYMEQFAEMLGVKFDEEFKISDCDNTMFKMTKNGFLFKRDDEWDVADPIIYEDLLTGKSKITKLPWKPIKGDACWCFEFGSNPVEKRSGRSFIDSLNYAVGNCYETKEEALADREDLMERVRKIAKENGRQFLMDEPPSLRTW